MINDTLVTRFAVNEQDTQYFGYTHTQVNKVNA